MVTLKFFVQSLNIFKIFDIPDGWNLIFSCGWQCGSTQTASSLPNSTKLRVEILNADWTPLCTQEIDMTNLGGGGNDPDNDGDGYPASQDCNDNDANLTVVGEDCNDGNATTENDLMQADCTCAGTPSGGGGGGGTGSTFWEERTENPAGIFTTNRTMIQNTLVAQKAIVQTNVYSDYVFEKDYLLLPLKELETFIEKNHHLPNIPPATEIVAKGIDISEMSVKHMEKIEELTLYLLQLNKRLEQVEKENKRLKKALRKRK